MAIAKTPVAGISKVTVAIGQKSNPSQVGQLVFFATARRPAHHLAG